MNTIDIVNLLNKYNLPELISCVKVGSHSYPNIIGAKEVTDKKNVTWLELEYLQLNGWVKYVYFKKEILK